MGCYKWLCWKLPAGSLRFYLLSVLKKKSPGIGFVNLTLPIPGFASVVGLAAHGLPGHWVQAAPGVPLPRIQLSFLLLGELFVGNHGSFLLDFSGIAVKTAGPVKTRNNPRRAA